MEEPGSRSAGQDREQAPVRRTIYIRVVSAGMPYSVHEVDADFSQPVSAVRAELAKQLNVEADSIRLFVKLGDVFGLVDYPVFLRQGVSLPQVFARIVYLTLK